MKTGLTSFDIAALIHEINGLVKGAYVTNIYQLDGKTILLKLRRSGQPIQQLLIEAGRRAHLTSYDLKKPKRPPAFCMALRKHLKNSRIRDIYQHEFERILIIELDTKIGIFKFIAELFGKGNIILVDPQGKIIHALTYRRMKDRSVVRGETYRHPPSSGKNPLKINRQDLDELEIYGKIEVVKALTKLLSISGFYAEEILLQSGVNKKTPCSSLSDEEIDAIFHSLQEITSKIVAGKIQPRIVVDEKGEWIDVTPIPLKRYEGFKQMAYTTFNEALDEYYVKMVIEREKERTAEKITEEIAKQERILQNQLEALQKIKAEAEKNRRIGETIYTHLGELQLLLQKIMDEKRRGSGWGEISKKMREEKEAGKTPAKYFHSLHPKNLILEISINSLTFPIDLRHSIQANAAKYYEMAKKAEKRLKGAEKAIEETKARIKELQQEGMKKLGLPEEKPPKRRKKAWYEKFRWFRSSEGFLVLGGKDAATNELLIKRYVEPHNIILNADIVGAPFVIVKTEGKTPSQQTLWESAVFTASYSRAWREMVGKVNVYWFRPEQISKTPPSGQYLKKGSFIIRGTKNYVRNVPLGLAIGVIIEDEQPLVICGPKEAVSKQTNIFVEVIPGEHSSSRLAMQIKQRLADKASKSLREKILKVPLEDIQRLIPLGRGSIKP